MPPLPQGSGPLVWLRLDPAAACDDPTAAQLAATLRAARPDLRLIQTHPAAPAPTGDAARPRAVPGTFGPPLPEPAASPEAVRAFLAHAAPAVILLLGADLPEAVLAEAERARIPLILAAARLGPGDATARRGGWRWPRSRGPSGLSRVQRVLVPDVADRDTALRLGAAPERIAVVGRLTATRRPLGCAEAERAALAAALRGRQSWLAVAVSEAEEAAVIEAHRIVLGHAHRALLILSPADPARAAPLAERLEAEGMEAALRSSIDEPEASLQVLVADDPGEFGLWYRLAPVTFLGGTLFPGHGADQRHPLEAAALGSAILHGPHLAIDHVPAFSELRDARAARLVAGAGLLGQAVDEMLAPDQAADHASRAWAVSTAGALVGQRIVAAVVEVLGKPG